MPTAAVPRRPPPRTYISPPPPSHPLLAPAQDDLLYEEELLRNPYSLKMWLRYLDARKDAPARRRYLLYERALKSLPGSYKASAADPTTPASCHRGPVVAGSQPAQGQPLCGRRAGRRRSPWLPRCRCARRYLAPPYPPSAALARLPD